MAPNAPGLFDHLRARQDRTADGILFPECHRTTSLVQDIEELCDPRKPVSDELVVNLVAKYFFAYIHRGSHREVVPLPEISGLYEMFSRHQSLNEPADDIETMNSLRRWSFALRMLGDLPKTAHILRSIILQHLPPEVMDRRYVGLDIGTGTGILLLAEYIQAHRRGFKDIETWGVEYDMGIGRRTGQLQRELGAGQVIAADARTPGAYRTMAGKAITFVSNETVSACHERLRKEHFVQIFYTLFAVLRGGLKHTSFFPEGLIVFSREQSISLVLSRTNGFQGPAAYDTEDFFPQGVVIEGQIVPLHQLGGDFLRFVPPGQHSWLSRRW